MEDRIIELETKIAFLENNFLELNQVVIDHEKTIRKLLAEIEDMEKDMLSMKEKLPANEKPPHY